MSVMSNKKYFVVSYSYQKSLSSFLRALSKFHEYLRMSSLFSGKTKEKQTSDVEHAINKLKQEIQVTEKREESLGKKISDCVERARQKAKNNAKKVEFCIGALAELRKKKRFKSDLDASQLKKMILEGQLTSLENKNTENKVLTSKNWFVIECIFFCSSVHNIFCDKWSNSSDENGIAAISGTSTEKQRDLVNEMTYVMDQVQEINVTSDQPLVEISEEDELEAELAVLMNDASNKPSTIEAKKEDEVSTHNVSSEKTGEEKTD
ncbi:hypothetical protein RFI_17771 [Reticulomyxa filosa]|uniref:Uncharacterized protein n=1 Tax=Reticulomyxa filosa TaxID=46433 RepID=X6MZL0_RETFI|nr:hypothetical protein RFI_17771 [Reticulomyxa filosa]|eukprot:ETO19460.1 hypothetical protein RFI_17771 [Reticulomyxa filosa]